MPKVDPQHVGDILAAFLDREVIPKADGLQKLGAALVGVAAARRAEQLVRQHAPALQFVGVLDETGMIDLDAAHELARDAFAKTGKVNVMGLLLDAADADRVYNIAKSFAQE